MGAAVSVSARMSFDIPVELRGVGGRWLVRPYLGPASVPIGG